MAEAIECEAVTPKETARDDLEWQREAEDGVLGNLFVRRLEGQDESLELCRVALGKLRLEIEAVNRARGHTLHKTGMMRWEGGEYLAHVLTQSAALFENCVVVEMGSGAVPLPSIAARSVHAQKCVVTDGCEEVLDVAKRNVERNLHLSPASTDVVFRRLVWGDPKDVENVLAECRALDWIVAADVVYSENGTAAFFQTTAKMLQTFPKARVLLAYVVRGVGDNRVLELAKAAGLSKTALLPEFVAASTEEPVQLALFVKSRSERRTTKCAKCDALASVLVRQRDPLCVSCLFHHVEAKFRYLFKTKNAIRPGDRVLIEDSGTAEAQSALDLLLLYRHPDSRSVRRGKTYFGLTILQDVCRPGADYAKEILARHGEASANVEFQTATSKEIDWDEQYPELDETGREDLRSANKRRFLVHQAQRHGCNVVISLGTSTALTQNLLAASCKGSGFGVPSGLELRDRRFLASNGVTLVRLLQELSATDLAYYCYFKGFATVGQRPRKASSVQSLTEQFVRSLHETFPSGVSSILRTGSKLQGLDGDAAAVFCHLCDDPVEAGHEQYCHSCQTHVVSRVSNDARMRRLTDSQLSDYL